MKFVAFIERYVIRLVRVFLRLAFWRSRFKNSAIDVDGGLRFLLHQVLPADARLPRASRYSPYYRKFGYKVPSVYGDMFSKWNGVSSDRYMSIDLYYNYAIPALNRFDFLNALTDKGGYSVLFRDVRQLVTVVKNRNGVWYSGDDQQIDELLAVEKCLNLPDGEYIIKPSVATACGRGIALFKARTREEVCALFRRYGRDFVIQKKQSQHHVMANLNASSLNTLRVYTYRDLKREIHFVDACSIVRIGGKGSIKDNVSAGGGFCAIMPDGRVCDRFLQEKTFLVRSLKAEKGIPEMRIPDYEKVKAFVKGLHERLPYFDWIGWDVAIDDVGECVFVEFNAVPFIEGPQMAHGPMFGEYLDEIMSRVQLNRRKLLTCEFLPVFKNDFVRIPYVVTY